MANPFNIEGAPLTVNVNANSASAVQSAITSARPGTVLNVTGATNQNIVLNAVNKNSPGVFVLLPETFFTRIEATNCSGIHFIGGLIASDPILGQIAASYGAELINSSRMSLRGARYSNSRNHIVTKDCSDIILAKNLMNYNRSDNMVLSAMQRFLIDDVQIQEAFAEWKTGYFANGTPPIYNRSEANTAAHPGAVNGAQGVTWQWNDAAHLDLGQATIGQGSTRTKHEDVTVRSLNMTALSQGFVTFGDSNNTVTPTPHVERLLIELCNLVTDQVGAIAVRGTDIEIRDNVVGVHPVVGLTPAIQVQPMLSGLADTRVRGGRNTAPAFIYNGITGVDLSSATINGATVAAAELPRIVFPAWVPEPVKPSASVFPNSPPEFLNPPIIVYMGTLTAGATWLSMRRGTVKLNGGVIDTSVGFVHPNDVAAGPTGWEYRWRLNGTIVSTNATYQAQSGSVVAEARVKTEKGWSGWSSSVALVVP